ncbi:hypothetical protein D3C85_1077030 [compost metagenome]
MVVGQIGVLVIGRVQIDEVGLDLIRDLHRIAPRRLARPGGDAQQQVREAQLQRLQRPRRPLLHIGHLQPGGGIHPVRRLHQGDQNHGLQLRLQPHGLDARAHGVDAGAVVGMEEAGVFAEGLGEPARLGRHRPQLGQNDLGLRRPALPVGLDIGRGERVGIGVVVVGPDAEALALQGMTDAGRAGKQVADRPAVRQGGAHRTRDMAQKRTL